MRDHSDIITDSPAESGTVAPAIGREVISGPGVRRTLNPFNLNTVANHPDVRPWLGGEGEIDLASLIADPRNFALEINGGGFLLIAREQGIYEAHSMFLPEARRHTVSAMRSTLEYMFVQTDMFRLVTQIPDDNPAAASLASRGGFKPWFRREDTLLGPSEFVMLELDGWVQGNASLEADGDWFHERLLAAKFEAGSLLPEHAHDPAHERAVGAAVRMIRAGNTSKGVSTYNRWAVCAGYAPLTILSFNPVVIDVVDAVIGLRGNEMEVLACR